MVICMKKSIALSLVYLGTGDETLKTFTHKTDTVKNDMYSKNSFPIIDLSTISSTSIEVRRTIIHSFLVINIFNLAALP